MIIFTGVHNCPQGWYTYGDYCYQINAHPNQRTTWENARQTCLRFNDRWQDQNKVAEADLVSITSKKENQMLIKQFKDSGITSRGRYFWTGLYKNDTANKFKWSDHTLLKYQNWASSSTVQRTSVCVKASLDDPNSGWFYGTCNALHYFVCKVKRGMSNI